MKTMTIGVSLCALLIAGSSASVRASTAGVSLMDAYRAIESKRFVDLTHAFSPASPHWKGFPKETVDTLYWYDPGVGKLGSVFFAQNFCHVGQWGTHVDPPAHFAKGGRTVDKIDPKEMFLPLVVVDGHE